GAAQRTIRVQLGIQRIGGLGEIGKGEVVLCSKSDPTSVAVIRNKAEGSCGLRQRILQQIARRAGKKCHLNDYSHPIRSYAALLCVARGYSVGKQEVRESPLNVTSDKTSSDVIKININIRIVVFSYLLVVLTALTAFCVTPWCGV
ncbi:hypothetical protein, partial [Salmonella enterica]|uniref:hypothetical protein n=1 Tax=Salmonella enterica TaxID=28901 RepID=UPI00398C4914